MITVIFLILTSTCLAVDKPINSFTGGRGSPLMEQRTDFEKYDTMSRQMENMIPFPQGTVNKRPGTKYVSPVPVSVTFSTVATTQYIFFPENDDLRIMTSLTGKRLSGDARWIGGVSNLVGLPSTGHGFQAGDTIQISGTTKYEAALSTNITIDSVTVDEIVIPTSYNESNYSETFDGTPVVLLVKENFFAPNTIWSGGSCQIGNYMYVPVVRHASEDTCIVRVDMDTITLDAEWADSPPSGWVAGQTGISCQPTAEGDGVLLRCNDPARNYRYALDGSCVWEIKLTGYDTYDADIDSLNRFYSSAYASGGQGNIAMRLKADGSAVDQWYRTDSVAVGAFACVVDDTNGFVYWGGTQNGALPTPGNFAFYKHDITTGDTYVTATTKTSIPGTATNEGIRRMEKIGDSLYCLYTTITYGGGNKNIFKTDTDFTVEASQYIEDAVSFYTEGDYLYVVREPAGNDTIKKLSLTDLSIVETIYAGDVENDGGFAILRNLPFVYEIYEEQYTINTTPPYGEFFAYRLIPFEYSTDDAYVLGFGENSLGFYRVGAQIEQ